MSHGVSGQFRADSREVDLANRVVSASSQAARKLWCRHFGSSHFCSNLHCYRVEARICFGDLLLLPGKTTYNACNASQGMDAGPRWMGADHPRTSTTVRELVQSCPQRTICPGPSERSPIERRQVAPTTTSSFECVSRDRGAGSQKTCRGDRGRIGSSGSSGDNRWPGGPSVERLPLQGEAFRPRATSGSADQPDGVVSREGKETLDCPRRSTSGTRDRCRGKRSSPRTSPCSCSCSRIRPFATVVIRSAQPSSEPPANGESVAGGARCVGTGAPGSTCGTPEGQTEIVPRIWSRHDSSHAHDDPAGSQRLGARTPRRVARSKERRTQFEGARANIDVVERCREDVRDDRRHDVLIDESRSHSRYGLRGVRVGEASHPGPPRRQSSRPIAGRDVIPGIHSDGAIQVDEK